MGYYDNRIKLYVRENVLSNIPKFIYEKDIDELIEELENIGIDLYEDNDLDLIKFIYAKMIYELGYFKNIKNIISEAEEMCEDINIEDVIDECEHYSGNILDSIKADIENYYSDSSDY